jgi:hypothetical protein
MILSEHEMKKVMAGVNSTPQPGMIGLTSISGGVGRAIELGQWLNGEGFQIWEHAFVLLPGNLILEAEPGGARIVPLHYDMVYWCAGLFKLLPPATTDLILNNTAADLKGIPYSFLDYASLAAHRLHIPAPGLRKFIADGGHEICSQLADDFYWRLGTHIFTDGRWAGDVTPAGLYRRDLQLR